MIPFLKNLIKDKYILDKEDMIKNSNRKYLKEYEPDFITAIFHSYTRQLPTSVLMEIDRIYTEESGKSLKTNFSCSNCVLKLMRQMGKLYFKENTDRLPEDIREKFISQYINK